MPTHIISLPKSGYSFVVNIFSYYLNNPLFFQKESMGSSQSKTETVYSRYPAESEIYTGIKLTPTVVDRIANPPTAFPEATPVANVDVAAIKVINTNHKYLPFRRI